MKNKYWLVIKGSRLEALRAMYNRGLLPVGGMRKLDREVAVETETAEWEKVYGWFGEPGRAPFPDGTLLYFRALS